jgi:hypothetical protein
VNELDKMNEMERNHGNILSKEQIDEFIENGILVVPNVLNTDEIESAREGFHGTLLSYGVDVNNLEETGKNLSKLSSTKGSGGVLDLFYMDWKLKLNEKENVRSVLQELWSQTYDINHPLFEHPFGSFNSNHAFMAIDRVCFRLPEQLSARLGGGGKHSLQRSLTPHLDCCPHRRFERLTRWKPIQCFLALTDCLEPNEGGFEAVPSFHREFDDWAKGRAKAKDGARDQQSVSEPSSTSTSSSDLDRLCVDQFTAIRPKEENWILDRFRPISYKAGDLILWDSRIPHANSLRNDHPTRVREVVYLGFLPAISLNKEFAADQLRRYREGGILPAGFWQKSGMKQSCDYSFSPLGRKLMGIEPWESEEEEDDDDGDERETK